MIYLNKLNTNKIVVIENKLHKHLNLTNDVPLGNMSICKFDETTYLLSIRQFNYKYFIKNGAINYEFIGKDKYENRNNFFVLVDKNFNFIKTLNIELKNNLDFKLLEDIRVLKIKNMYCVSGTYYKNSIVQICIFSMKLNNDKFTTTNNCYLSKNDFSQPQKNWIPVEGNFLKYIKNLNTNEIEFFNFNENKIISCKNCIKISGSSNLLKYKNKYIALVHSRKNSVYSYRFLILSNDFSTAYFSDEFKFFDSSIEFSCGMLIDENEIIIPATENDSKTSFFKIDAEYLLNDVLKIKI